MLQHNSISKQVNQIWANKTYKTAKIVTESFTWQLCMLNNICEQHCENKGKNTNWS